MCKRNFSSGRSRKNIAMKNNFPAVHERSGLTNPVGAGSARPFVRILRHIGQRGRGTKERIRLFDLPRRKRQTKSGGVNAAGRLCEFLRSGRVDPARATPVSYRESRIFSSGKSRNGMIKGDFLARWKPEA